MKNNIKIEMMHFEMIRMKHLGYVYTSGGVQENRHHKCSCMPQGAAGCVHTGRYTA